MRVSMQGKTLFRKYPDFRSHLLVFIFLSAASQSLWADDSSLVNEISQVIASKQHTYLQRADFTNRAEDLEALYKMAGNKLLWQGNPQAEKNRLDALSLLENAAVNGLDPEAYDVTALQQKRPTEAVGVANDYRPLVLYDTAVSLSLLRYFHDLHYGRVNPKQINFNLKLREKKQIDLPTVINDSLNANTLAQLPELVEPKLKQYQSLKKSLAVYQLLQKAHVAYNLVSTVSIKPGETLSNVGELDVFLVAVGDLPKANDSLLTKNHRYSERLVGGIKKFQARHGITPDGVLGKSTVEALNVPIAQRVNQIELAMERLRWLPEVSAGASIIVNIPAFQLWAFDDVNEIDANMTNMRVVVGKAMQNETPVLMAEMRFIDFMPYWNVPYNIVKKEILPKLLQNSNYLAKENMEMVSTFGGGAKEIPFTAGAIQGLNQGSIRIRQRPGKKNALGKVKFMFPNKNDVYLHDTPSHNLFSRTRRDFSHGCVRVEHPAQLAEFVLKNQLTKEAITEALQTEKTKRVILKKSIPVLFFYVTSFMDQHNNLAFISDIYGYDEILKAELKKGGDVSDQDIFAPPVVEVPAEIKLGTEIKPNEVLKPEVEVGNPDKEL